jgi:hypothetical protein
LADEHDGATAVPEATRARVIRTLAERKPRRRKWFVVGVPAFVLFGGSTAWASMTGNLPAVVEKAISVVTFGAVEFDEEPEVRIRTRVFERKAAPAVEPVEALVDAAASDEEEVEAPVGEPEEQLVPTEEPVAKEVTPPPVKPAPALDPFLTIYQSAHRAQFRAGDCHAAVQGYADYLSAAPSGSFAVDARYNRAVCLIKLGRTSEARTILQPFSEGRYGSYRQKRAGKLLEAFE